MLFAGRELIREEFAQIVEVQRSFHGSPLAAMLTDELVQRLDDPELAYPPAVNIDNIDQEQRKRVLEQYRRTWRHGGLLFGQRRTYWHMGTLGRCVLEPTDRCVPVADRHAGYFRVVETANNIRITLPGEPKRALTPEERQRVVQYLRGDRVLRLNPLGLPVKPKMSTAPKEVKPKHLEEILGIDAKVLASHNYVADACKLQFASADPERNINTDWFHREIVHGAIGAETWSRWEEAERREANLPAAERSPEAQRPEAVNRAILRFDPDQPADEQRLRQIASSHWGLESEAAERLIDAWKRRPKLEKRLNLSRRAILNLLPFMERFDEENNRWPTQQEARKAYAKVLQSRFEQNGNEADQVAARRYATGALGLAAADRHYMRPEKHQIKQNGQIVRDAEGRPLAALPPAPMLSNPVVRKAIHEVRRHLLAYLRKFGRKPDRVVIEFARGVKDTARNCNLQLKANRQREAERKEIEKKLRDWQIPQSNWHKAVLRVRLCREQNGVCPFSLQGPNVNRTITERMAAEGQEVEIEHIVPEALSGKTMAFNNLVLCFREANRGKAMRTPADWLGPEGLQAMLQRLENAPIRQNRVKWDRLQAPTPDEDAFRNSQLTDTAYAARQVAAYLADALFDGQGLPERGGPRRIFTTKGEFTARLRADWGLHESTIDRAHGLELPPNAEALRDDPALEQASRRARKEPKDRSDHRHHALDALAIAMVGPELLAQLGRMARKDREYRERTGYWPRHEAIDPPSPWTKPPSFHQDVLAAFEKLIVSHRAVKRRLVGAFHEETHYGPVIAPLPRHRTEDAGSLFTNRIAVSRLTNNHLRVPEGWDELSRRLDDPTLPRHQKRAIRRELAAMKDPLPSKSGIVRDRALRDRLRKCLKENGVDPDGFTAKQLKDLLTQGKLTMASGVPIKSVVLLRTIADPVIIPRKNFDSTTSRMDRQIHPKRPQTTDSRSDRVYIGGNNHHVEIRQERGEDRGEVATEWTGRIVTSFEAAQRVRPAKRLAASSRDAVDRCDNEQGIFVMSLAEGEMIYARRKDRPCEPPNYYVVCKLDRAGSSCRIHFAPHWDARKASEQDRWNVTPADLKHCGPEPGKPPEKVRVDPLGNVVPLERD